jgi:hypothetical protein
VPLLPLRHKNLEEEELTIDSVVAALPDAEAAREEDDNDKEADDPFSNFFLDRNMC